MSFRVVTTRGTLEHGTLALDALAENLWRRSATYFSTPATTWPPDPETARIWRLLAAMPVTR